MNLEELKQLVVDFEKERNWTATNPNMIITSLIIELGELAEHYQWKSEYSKLDEVKKKELGYEFTDVIFYLLQLAAGSDIDIEHYFLEKLEKLKIKYPPGVTEEDYYKTKEEYRKTGKNKTY